MNDLRGGLVRILLLLRRRYRTVIARGLVLVAVTGMIASAFLFLPQLESLAHYRPTRGPQDYYDPLAPWCFVGGLLALLAALAILSPGEIGLRLGRNFRERSGGLEAASPRWSFLLVVPGALALLALAEINGRLIGIKLLADRSPLVQFALLVAGVGLVVIGLAGFPRAAHPQAPDLDDTRPTRRQGGAAWTRRDLPFVLLITLAALAVRFWNLRDSVHVMVDEGHFALGVTYFWEFPHARLLEPMPTSASFPFIFSYGQTAMTAIFGRSFLGLRAFSAVLGALTVPALYLLARQLYDRRTAVIAALVLLTFPPQVHYSRLALNNIADPLFGTLALGLLMAGVRTQRRRYYVLAGAALGFTQYFYEGGRLLYPLLALAWMGGGLVLWRPRPSVRGLILAALVFALVALPIYYTLIGEKFPLTDRFDKTSYNTYYWNYHREPDNLHTRINHLRHALMVFVNAPENTTFNYYLYYGGKYPLILPPIVPLFLLGIGFTLWRWRTPRALPLGWLIAVVAGNAMLIESAVSARYVVVFPALALLIAIGITETPALLWPARWPPRVLTGLLAALTGLVVIGQGVFYFGDFLKLFNVEVRAALAYDVDDAMLRAAKFPPGTRIFVIGYPTLPEIDAQRLLNYLADDLHVYVFKPEDFATLDLGDLDRQTDLAFFIGADDAASLAQVEAAYGDRPLQRTPYPVPGGKALLLFYVAAGG